MVGGRGEPEGCRKGMCMHKDATRVTGLASGQPGSLISKSGYAMPEALAAVFDNNNERSNL